MPIRPFIAAAIIAASSIIATTTHAQPLTDSFVYQGTLNDNGAPANGLYDISFFIYDAEVGGNVPPDGFTTVFNVEVIDGLFSCEVDFGVAGQLFNTNQTQWLELRVSPAGVPGTTILAPRTKLAPTTLANYALRSGFATSSGTSLQGAYENDNRIFLEDIHGAIELYSTVTQEAQLNFFNPINDLRASIGYNALDNAGYLLLGGPLNQSIGRMELDVSTGGGGYLTIARNNQGQSGINLEGNAAGSESSRLSIFGTQSIFEFNTNSSGSSAAFLPTDAIDSAEILNEVGATETTSGSSLNLTNNGTTVDVINSVTINAPASGFVLVLASAEVTINHINGETSTVLIGVSDSDVAFDNNTDLEIKLDPDIPSGLYDFPFSSHALYPVSAGSNTFYFLGDDNNTGGPNITIFDRQVSAIYIPTTYGSISRNPDNGIPDELAPSTGPLNAYDILAEQNAALQADNERQQRELDEMRAMMEQIKNEMQREQRQQSRD